MPWIGVRPWTKNNKYDDNSTPMTAIVQCVPVEARPPSLQDNSADIERLKKAVKEKIGAAHLIVPLAQVTTVSRRFRQAYFSGVALVNEREGRFELVDFLAQMPVSLPAMALDLGTTHLEATLIDLLNGRCLAQANQENPQIACGDDILSRIHYAGREDGLVELHEKIINAINALAGQLAEQAHVEMEQIRALSVSGNPTMAHLFLGLDPYTLCREPYIPVVNAPDTCLAGELHLSLSPTAPVLTLPSVGSYFGGDLISGILSSGMDLDEKPSMLIDVGTNAEVVLGNSEWLIACAGAAGPALEGGVARMGMRAGFGAIEHVRINQQNLEVVCRTIGDSPARGICGSGIIDLVAELYRAQVIDLRGKFRPVADPQRIRLLDGAYYYELVPPHLSADGKAVGVSQVDIDAVMRSKAAMYAILTTLVSQVGLEFSELARIYVAGAFGRHINPEKAITLGMLPDLPLSMYEPIGNSSLAGAEEVLLHDEARTRCRGIMQKITYIELNVNQEFMMRFSGAKFIPHTDRTLFPTVPVFEYT